MSNSENSRIERDARRAVAHRKTTGSSTEQAVLRHLGVELYKESHRTEARPQKAMPEETEEGADGSTGDTGTAGPASGPAVPSI
ncbi:hypothetical protein OHA18_42005 [Kribbella sp. NBC_00709]|uniref:hypothetical protein n=1 Tax=Kribbella sp. NBC_00709 TaxID=2975972 RepID=UPI002E2DB7E5|nr:hypothetical protein [Kribbella sp. NBC_00709]